MPFLGEFYKLKSSVWTITVRQMTILRLHETMFPLKVEYL